MSQVDVQELWTEVAPYQRIDLCRLMSEISEDHMCAGWDSGLEFRLWSMVQGGLRDYGVGEVPESVVAGLRTLAENCGGWWCWPRGADEPAFVPMAEWLEAYAAMTAAQ